jgi:DNA-3-methyladenine glycosylase II
MSQGFALQPLGPFSLRAAAAFWGDFTPAGHGGLDDQGHLHLAFPVEGTWTSVGVCLRQVGDAIVGDTFGEIDEPSHVKAQTARILSLDVDGRAFEGVARRDPIAGELQRQYPGLRPVCFYSPYEAAAWAIISQRIHRQQAANIKARLCEALGETLDIHGQPMRAFPAPQRLLSVTDVPALFGRKSDSLRAVAHAALDGRLNAAYLRSLSEEQALESLLELPGIGPFSAELIVLRGAGHPDYLTLREPKFRRALGRAYALPAEPTDADVRRVSEAWRPYRTWVTFLLRQQAA